MAAISSLLIGAAVAGGAIHQGEMTRRSQERASDIQKEQEARLNKQEAEAKLKKEQDTKRIDATRQRAYQRASLISMSPSSDSTKKPSLISSDPGAFTPGSSGGQKTLIGA